MNYNSSLQLRSTFASAFLALVGVLGSVSATAQDGQSSSPIKVEKDKSLSFDPKTCTQGQATVFWALGSTSVKVLGHKDGHCVFELKAEVEGGYRVYLCKVPVDGGVVTVGAGMPPKTSFPLDKCKVIRGGNMLNGSQWLPIEGTDQVVHYRDAVAGKGPSPQTGDKVRIKLSLFADAQYKELLKGTKPSHEVEFTLGQKNGWKWLQSAVADMQPGGKRHVWIEGKSAEGAKGLVPNFDAEQRLYIEVEVLSVTAAKE
jgi:hypothetical protein